MGQACFVVFASSGLLQNQAMCLGRDRVRSDTPSTAISTCGILSCARITVTARTTPVERLRSSEGTISVTGQDACRLESEPFRY